jgi:RND family efflux transporter MFP subunit
MAKRGVVCGAVAAMVWGAAAFGQAGGALPPAPVSGRSLGAPLPDAIGTGSGNYTIVNGMMKVRGQTEPAAKVEVPSVLRGQIVEVDVKEGETVKKGQVLAKLDDALQVLAVQSAQLDAANDAGIRNAQASIDFAKNDLERVTKSGAASETERRQKALAVTQAEIELDFQKAKLASAQIKLKVEQATLERMTIKSPLDGQVLRLPKQAGEETDENPVAVVVQTNKLAAKFFLPRSLFGKVAAGQRVKLSLETDPGTEREAVVTAVDPAVDPAGLFQVKLDVDNGDGKIPAGTPAVWLVPVGAVAANGGAGK